MEKERMIEILRLVTEDLKNDAADFDGKPFTGRTMAEYMGNHGAAIAAVANVLKEFIKSSNPTI